MPQFMDSGRSGLLARRDNILMRDSENDSFVHLEESKDMLEISAGRTNEFNPDSNEKYKSR